MQLVLVTPHRMRWICSQSAPADVTQKLNGPGGDERSTHDEQPDEPVTQHRQSVALEQRDDPEPDREHADTGGEHTDLADQVLAMPGQHGSHAWGAETADGTVGFPDRGHPEACCPNRDSSDRAAGTASRSMSQAEGAGPGRTRGSRQPSATFLRRVRVLAKQGR